MRGIAVWSVSMAALLVWIRTAGVACGIEIARDGIGRAKIVTAEGSSAPVQHAANELKAFLKEATGADLPHDPTGSAKSPRILVGAKAALLADPRFSVDGLGKEGMVIRTVGDDLILAGGEPRGTLYAVYTFLEEHVGCRWWTPSVRTIPRKPTLSWDAIDVRYVPPVEYREPYWDCAFDRDWAARNRINGTHMPLTAETGGKEVIEGFVHTFFPLIPPQKYFRDHPDWFSEIEGRRTADHTQLCLSNDDMRRELVKNLKLRLRRNRLATQASVSQNDWAGYCRCPRCRAVDAEEGGPSGSILRFVNAVAADIEEEFPHAGLHLLRGAAEDHSAARQRRDLALHDELLVQSAAQDP